MEQPDLEALVSATIAGDVEAWRQLWRAVEPKLYAQVRRPQLLGRLAKSEDDCRNIVVEIMARLRAGNFARLGAYAAARRQSPSLSFDAWLLVVARRVAIDYLRAQETYIDRRHDKEASKPGGWREREPLPSDSQLGARPPITDLATAHEALESAEDLPDEQRRALSAWLEGASFAEIAGDGDDREAARRVRAALLRLRRRFREPRG